MAFAGAASAKDMKGRFGAGGQVSDLGGVGGGLSLNYWVSDLGIQALIGLEISGDPDDDGPAEGTTGLGLGLRVKYNIARANDTNMYALAGARFGLIDEDAVIIDIGIGVEHFFTDYFSVAGEVGLGIDVGGDVTSVALGTTLPWGFAFHFYF
ncbi:MAG: hypothetical protein IT385_21345 [Deltaproteobacteria bacterium]|nr:hypothetical protein [Deltaproteobacteria bacterium]